MSHVIFYYHYHLLQLLLFLLPVIAVVVVLFLLLQLFSIFGLTIFYIKTKLSNKSLFGEGEGE